jgi:hypothetical protein
MAASRNEQIKAESANIRRHAMVIGIKRAASSRYSNASTM